MWILAVLAGVVGLQYVLPHALKRLQLRRLRSRTRGCLVLSYDDGPWEGLTPELLALLETRGARATFFLLGHKVARAPDLARCIEAAGHQIGSHSRRHLHPWKTDPVRCLADVAGGHRDLEEVGLRPSGYRPQYGKITLTNWVWALASGQPLRWWTIDSGDTRPSRDLETLVREVERQEGGVVLLHDGVAPGERRSFVLGATAALLDLAARKGWRVGGFEELDAVG